jgi:UPF0176 protein
MLADFTAERPMPAETTFHDAFYRFVPLAEPDAVASWLVQLTQGLMGSILVASEGINGTVAGSAPALDAFREAVTREAAFAGLAFKRSHCTTAPFGRMRVHRKPEIVALGFAHTPLVATTKGSVAPAEWRTLLAQDDVVVIDNRNSFEYRLGHFHRAIDPQVTHFRDFPHFIETNAPQWKAEGKRVAMYCTGGIRCEKTAAWMQQAHGLDVLQLEGGILNHFQQLPDAERDWTGECFVFDNRIALDTTLQETATTAEQVYADEPGGEWRLARARRLDEAV